MWGHFSQFHDPKNSRADPSYTAFLEPNKRLSGENSSCYPQPTRIRYYPPFCTYCTLYICVSPLIIIYSRQEIHILCPSINHLLSLWFILSSSFSLVYLILFFLSGLSYPLLSLWFILSSSFSLIYLILFFPMQGISMGVASVISDYAPQLPPLLVAQGEASKYLQLGGSPWRGEAEGAERLQVRVSTTRR